MQSTEHSQESEGDRKPNGESPRNQQRRIPCPGHQRNTSSKFKEAKAILSSVVPPSLKGEDGGSASENDDYDGEREPRVTR